MPVSGGHVEVVANGRKHPRPHRNRPTVSLVRGLHAARRGGVHAASSDLAAGDFGAVRARTRLLWISRTCTQPKRTACPKARACRILGLLRVSRPASPSGKARQIARLPHHMPCANAAQASKIAPPASARGHSPEHQQPALWALPAGSTPRAVSISTAGVRSLRRNWRSRDRGHVRVGRGTSSLRVMRRWLPQYGRRDFGRCVGTPRRRRGLCRTLHTTWVGVLDDDAGGLRELPVRTSSGQGSPSASDTLQYEKNPDLPKRRMYNDKARRMRTKKGRGKSTARAPSKGVSGTALALWKEVISPRKDRSTDPLLETVDSSEAGRTGNGSNSRHKGPCCVGRIG